MTQTIEADFQVDGRESFEGEIAFGYDDGPPPPRTVTLFAHDVEETVDAAFFERFVVEYALACIEAGRKIGVDAGSRYEADLIARRRRYA